MGRWAVQFNSLTPINNDGTDPDDPGDTIFVDFGTASRLRQLGDWRTVESGSRRRQSRVD